jgi:hypothetical protein
MNQENTAGDIHALFEKAKKRSRRDATGRRRAIVGACVVVRPGEQDVCREMTEAECNYVDRKLQEAGTGLARWSAGRCP